MRKDLTYRLAAAVSDFHCAADFSERKPALEHIHHVILDIAGPQSQKTYHQRVAAEGLEPMSWRPQVIGIAQTLRYDGSRFTSADDWLQRARALLAPFSGVRAITKVLPRTGDLDKALSSPMSTGHRARTIHSVKGMEFPAVCVVLSTAKAKGVLDYLAGEGGTTEDTKEEVRKLYVGASRAQRLLVVAAPKSQATRLATRLKRSGASVFEEDV